MDMVIFVGLAAAFCTTVSFLPQVIKILRTGNTESISLGMYAIFTFGVLLWLIYGIVVCNLPIIAANAVTTVLSGSVLVLKLRDVLRKR